MSGKFHDVLFGATEEMRNQATDLNRLANAFRMTGNDKVADQLAASARDIARCAQDLLERYIEQVDENAAHARQATDNLVFGFTKGIEIGEATRAKASS